MSKNNEIDNKIADLDTVAKEDVVAVHEENKEKQPSRVKKDRHKRSSTEAECNKTDSEKEVNSKTADLKTSEKEESKTEKCEAKIVNTKDVKVREGKTKEAKPEPSKLLKYLSENYRVVIPVAFSVIIILIAGIMAATGNLKQVDTDALGAKPEEVAVMDLSLEDTPVTAIEEGPELLVQNTDAILLDVVTNYYSAIANGDVETVKSIRDSVSNLEETKINVRSRYIESYSNIQCYTVNGPVEGSYLAFVSYDVKFNDIQTPAPGLISMYICPDVNGNLKIYRDEMDEKTTAFFKSKLDNDNVQELCDRIEIKYREAIDADESLSTFMLTFEDKVKEEVAVEIAYAEAQNNMISVENPGSVEEPEPKGQEPETQEQDVEPGTPNDEAGQTAFVSEEVRTTTAVNVRSSDSETADKIGRADMGITLTRLENKVNGWSKVLFDGKEGYIKSEYLNAVGQKNVSEATGKVKVLETVRVRASASTDGQKLGSAYTGEVYDLLMEQADGWTKINFNGQTAYIKSEFVQIQ